MKVLEVDDALAPLKEYVRGISDEPVVLTVGGKPVAALVALRNADLESVSLSNNPSFLAIIERSRERMRLEGGISAPEARARLQRTD